MFLLYLVLLKMLDKKPSQNHHARPWKRGRAVECNGLENRRRCEPSVSSNLTASAKYSTKSTTYIEVSILSHIKTLIKTRSGLKVITLNTVMDLVI